MKKIITLLFVGFITLAINAQEKKLVEKVQDPNAPVFKFDSEIIDYGKIEVNADGVRVFRFKNIGKSPLIITKIKSSCGCTVPKKPTDPILPGETGEIEVKYDTKRLGGFSKMITVTSNASEAVKRLRIKGIVIKPESAIEKKKSIISS
jgi:archaellum component FlaG (FlaF/FlaG flagellin family)